jgi:hypothetical protein
MRTVSMRSFRSFGRLAVLAAGVILAVNGVAQANSVSFLVEPDDYDANNDGFITDDEFQPEGMDGGSPDGVIFALVPTNNLVGGDRFLLAPDTGLHFGGGGGSTLSFDFTLNADIELETYTLADNGFILGDPIFDILDGGDVLSMANTAVDNGDTYPFNGGPLLLDAGTTYSFNVTDFGAGIQSFMASWQYTVVPEPASCILLGAMGLTMVRPRRRR